MPTFFVAGEVLRRGASETGTRMRSVDDRLRKELASAAEQADCELLHVEFRGSTLRLVLDRPEGIGLAECQSVSRRVSALLDSLEFDPGHYVLEVTSPGLDREFYGPHDYERFVGRLVRVRFQDPSSGRPRTVVGRLAEYEPVDGGRINVVATEDRKKLLIRLDEIEKARLEVEV